ncbi:MAG: hypothetical protein LBU04_05835 [Christensenellaceae bacterium]|jgi:hypothetical protein|nr:hypothetical protein [Christensenellaceae bacterium]
MRRSLQIVFFTILIILLTTVFLSCSSLINSGELDIDEARLSTLENLLNLAKTTSSYKVSSTEILSQTDELSKDYFVYDDNLTTIINEDANSTCSFYKHTSEGKYFYGEIERFRTDNETTTSFAISHANYEAEVDFTRSNFTSILLAICDPSLYTALTKGFMFTKAITIELHASKATSVTVNAFVYYDNMDCIIAETSYQYTDTDTYRNVNYSFDSFNSNNSGLESSRDEELNDYFQEQSYFPVTDMIMDSKIEIHPTDNFVILPAFAPVNASDTRITCSLEGIDYEQFVSLNGNILTAKSTPTLGLDIDIYLSITSKDMTSLIVTIPIIIIPDFSLELDDQTMLKQLITPNTPFVPFELNIVGLDDYSFTVIWAINGMELTDTGRTLSIEFSDYLSIGHNLITATILSNQVQLTTVKSIDLGIFDTISDLECFISNEYILVGDSVSVYVQIGKSGYSPDKYEWYMAYEKDAILIESEHQILDPIRTIKESVVSVFEFQLNDQIDYSIYCIPYFRDIPLLHSMQTITVSSDQVLLNSFGTEITNLYFDAMPYDNTYAITLNWDPILYDATYTLRLTHGSYLYFYTSSSLDPNIADRFTNERFVIPNVVSFNDDFTIEIRTSNYEWSSISYNQKLANVTKKFFSEVSDRHNSYIANIFEFGKLYNHISVFRPAVYSEDSNPAFGEIHDDIFKVTLYFAFQYADIAEIYPLTTDYPNNTGTFNQNAYSLLRVVANYFGESYSFKYSVSEVENEPNAITYSLAFTNISKEATLQTSSTNLTEYGSVNHYSKSDDKRTSLPVDMLTQTKKVSTGDQLYLALSQGYKPLLVSNSAAEAIYSIARNTLLRIIDDNMSNPQKIHAIYDFLTSEVIYDYELLSIAEAPNTSIEIHDYDGFSIDGVFLRKQAVCDGIAKAFVLLTAMERITSKKVMGKSMNQGHAWNIVLLDGMWYLVDATWGSSLWNDYSKEYEIQDHQFLLRSKEDFQDSHNPDIPYPISMASESFQISYDTGVYYYVSSDTVIDTVKYIRAQKTQPFFIDFDITSITVRTYFISTLTLFGYSIFNYTDDSSHLFVAKSS